MKFLHARTGSAQNLAFVALMCALNAVVATLSTLVPLSSLFVIIFLPLVSVLTVILCEDKYAIIYLVAAIALSLGVTAYDITATLFYIIPAIVVGTLYDFLSKKNFPLAYTIFVTSILEMGLNYAALPLIKLLSGQDFLLVIETLLGVEQNPVVPYLVPSLIFIYSLMEVILASITSSLVMQRFGLKQATEGKLSWLYSVLAISFSLVAIGLAFAEISWGYWGLFAGIYFLFYALWTYFRKLPVWTYILLGLSAVAGWVVFACFYRSFPPYAGPLLLGVVTISFAIPALIVRLLFRVTPPVTQPQKHE